MPKIEKVFSLEITPERFLIACSPEELMEIDMLLSSPRFQHKMNHNELYGDSLAGKKFANESETRKLKS